MTKNSESLKQEFERQAQNLTLRNYPKIAGLTSKEFSKHIERLRKKAANLTVSEVDLEQGHLPFVLVVKSDLVDSKQAMSLVVREGRTGVDVMRPHEPKDFQTIEAVNLPAGMAYLLLDIDRGRGTLNMAPIEALKSILRGGRSPLTIAEGVAIVTHYPDFLKKNNCFSLLASRVSGNQRVPAIWINSRKQPNLGWCWDGNPHTWLGSASCRSRVGV